MKKYLVFSVKSVLGFFSLIFFQMMKKIQKTFKERKVEKLSFVKLTLSPSLDVMNLWLNLFNVLLTLRAWYPSSTLKPGT